MNLAQAKAAVGQTSPVFDNPPVVETAIGLRFAPIDGFNAAHLGQLFITLHEYYERFELKPPIGASVQFSFDAQQASFNIPMRCWYVNGDNTQLLQVQSDLLIRNWRATEKNRQYQHYDAVRPLFHRDWKVFCAFLEDHGMKRPVVWQCEVAYVNHLIRGREWNQLSDLAGLFPIWKGIEGSGILKSLEMATFSTAFRLPDESGHITFNLQPALTQEGNEILQLTVTASGKPEDQDDSALLDWMDYAHFAVVNGFVQFTSPEAHKVWRKA